MRDFAPGARRQVKAGLAVLGIATIAVPAASAFATAADPTQPAIELTAEQVETARATFNDFACGACHSLSDAGATGKLGPSLDGDASLDHNFIVDRVVNGQGAMPGFGGQISDEEIGRLATYILQVKK